MLNKKNIAEIKGADARIKIPVKNKYLPILKYLNLLGIFIFL